MTFSDILNKEATGMFVLCAVWYRHGDFTIQRRNGAKNEKLKSKELIDLD